MIEPIANTASKVLQIFYRNKWLNSNIINIAGYEHHSETVYGIEMYSHYSKPSEFPFHGNMTISVGFYADVVDKFESDDAKDFSRETTIPISCSTGYNHFPNGNSHYL